MTPSQTIKNKVPQAQTSSAATRQKVSANKNFDSLNIQSRALIFNDPPGGDINNLYSKAPKTLIYPTHAFRLPKTKTYRVINATLFMLGPFHRMTGACHVFETRKITFLRRTCTLETKGKSNLISLAFVYGPAHTQYDVVGV